MVDLARLEILASGGSRRAGTIGIAVSGTCLHAVAVVLLSFCSRLQQCEQHRRSATQLILLFVHHRLCRCWLPSRPVRARKSSLPAHAPIFLISCKDNSLFLDQLYSLGLTKVHDVEKLASLEIYTRSHRLDVGRSRPTFSFGLLVFGPSGAKLAALAASRGEDPIFPIGAGLVRGKRNLATSLRRRNISPRYFVRIYDIRSA